MCTQRGQLLRQFLTWNQLMSSSVFLQITHGCYLAGAKNQRVSNVCFNPFGIATRKSIPNTWCSSTQRDWAEPFPLQSMEMVVELKKKSIGGVLIPTSFGIEYGGLWEKCDHDMPLRHLSWVWWCWLPGSFCTTPQQQVFNISDAFLAVCVSIKVLCHVRQYLGWLTDNNYGWFGRGLQRGDHVWLWTTFLPSMCWFQTGHGVDGEGGFLGKELSKRRARKLQKLLSHVWRRWARNSIWGCQWERSMDPNQIQHHSLAKRATMAEHSIWQYQTC